MVMCTSVDIFQANVDKLLIDIECVKTYVSNIMVLIKWKNPKRIEQIRVIFSSMHNNGLKVNDKKFSFWLNSIP